MILILGAGGHVGQAFVRELGRRRLPFIPLTRAGFDYTSPDQLLDYVRRVKPRWVINAVGYWGEGRFGNWGINRERAFLDNALLPQIIRRVCLHANIPWAHVSSSSIYTGAKVLEGGSLRIEPQLDSPGVLELFERNPERFFGFTEFDTPNASFRNSPCSILGGTRCLGEEGARGGGQTYIWRLSTIIHHRAEPWNWLTHLRTAPGPANHVTSLSHLGEFARACVDLAERRAPYGTYNIANPGALSVRQARALIRNVSSTAHVVRSASSQELVELCNNCQMRCNSILDVTKLLRAGVQMRSARQALEACLLEWEQQPELAEKSLDPSFQQAY